MHRVNSLVADWVHRSAPSTWLHVFWLGFLLPVVATFPENCLCDTTIRVEARPNSSAVFLDRGMITVDYDVPLAYVGASTDGDGPGNSGNTVRVLVSADGVDLAVQPVESVTLNQMPGSPLVNSGTFSFYNPSSQFVQISGSGVCVLEKNQPVRSLYPVYQEWMVLNGQTAIVGGDTPRPVLAQRLLLKVLPPERLSPLRTSAP